MKVISIHSESAGRDAMGRAHVDYCSHKVALKRALMCTGIIWGMALGGLFMPWMQIFLPPTFVIIGIAVGIFVYIKTLGLPQTLVGEVPCAHCGKAGTFQFENVRPPFYSMCTSCKTGYKIIWPPKN